MSDNITITWPPPDAQSTVSPKDYIKSWGHDWDHLSSPPEPTNPPAKSYVPSEDGLPRWAGIARLGGVGDNLIAASVLAPLKRMGYKIDVLSEPPHHVVFYNNPYIDKLSIKTGEKDLPQGDMLKWQEWFAGRSREYERFANLSHSCETLVALVPAMTWFWHSQEWRRKFCDRNYLEAVHDIVGVPYEFGPLYFSSPAEHAKALEWKDKMQRKRAGPLIGWCLSGTRFDKIYPWTALAIARIIKELGSSVVMMGKPGRDFEIAKGVLEQVQKTNGMVGPRGEPEGLHLALSPDENKPTWPIRSILTLAQNCDLVVAPDTGPAWAVAFEQMPKVILLSHASATNITKHWVNTTTLQADQSRVPCHPCHRLHDTPATCIKSPLADAAACIADIPVEAVISAIKNALAKN